MSQFIIIRKYNILHGKDLSCNTLKLCWVPSNLVGLMYGVRLMINNLNNNLNTEFVLKTSRSLCCLFIILTATFYNVTSTGALFGFSRTT